MKTNRLSYWDNWKGLAIIAVVMIHATNKALTFPEGSFNYNFGLGVRQFINYAVPLFLAMSGYFSISAIQEDTLSYYRKRVSRIIVPYGIWTAIYLFLVKTPEQLPSLYEIAHGYILGSGIGIGYFVIVLLQYIAVTPLLLKIKSFKTHIFIIGILTFSGLAFTYFFRTQYPESFFAKFPGSAILFVVWYPFYHLGMLAALFKNRLNFEKFTSTVLLSLFILALAFSFIEGFSWSHLEYNRLSAKQLKISSFTFSIVIFIIAIAYAHKESWLNSQGVFSLLGRYSFAIYLMHLLFFKIIHKTSILKPLVDIQPLYIFSLTALSIAGCMIFVSLVEKFAPKMVSKSVIG